MIEWLVLIVYFTYWIFAVIFIFFGFMAIGWLFDETSTSLKELGLYLLFAFGGGWLFMTCVDFLAVKKKDKVAINNSIILYAPKNRKFK